MQQDIDIRINFEEGPGPIKTITQLQELSNQAKEMKKDGDAAFEEMSDSAEGFEKQLIDTLGELNAYLKGVDQASKKNKEASYSWKDAARNINIFGTNLGDVVGSLESKKNALDQNIKGVGGLTKGWSAFNKVLAASIIGAILLVITSLVAVVKKSQAGIDFLRTAFAAFGAVVDVTVGRLISFGRTIIALFSGDFDEAGRQLTKTFNGFQQELIAVTANAVRLEQALIAVEKAELRLRAKRATANVELKALNLIVEDTTQSYKAREDAAVSAFELEQKLIEEEKSNSRQRLAILFGEAEVTEQVLKKIELAKAGIINLSDIGLTESTEEDVAAITDEIERLSAAEAGSLELRTTIKNKLNVIREQQRAEIEATIQKQKELNEAYDSEIEKLQDRIRAVNLSVLKEKEALATGEERLELTKQRIELEKAFALQELDNAEQVARDRAAAAKRVFDKEEEFLKLRQEVTEAYNRQIVAEELKLQGEILQAQVEADKEQRELEDATNERRRKQQLQQIDDEQKIELAKVDLIKQSTDEALDLEQFKQLERFKIQKDALEKQRRFLVQEFGPDSAEVQLLDLSIDKLKQDIQELESIDLSPLQRIKAKILDALGLNDEEAKILGDQIAGIYENLTNAIITSTDSQIEQQERLIASYDTRIGELQSRLSEELKLREDGLANNAAIIEEEIATTQEQREQAARKAEALKRKQLKTQLAIDASQQVSNLVTTVSELLKSSSKFGPIAGLILAGSSIAAFISLFSKFKAESKKLAADVPQFRGGGLLDDTGLILGDHSHEKGGVAIQYGNRLIEAESGEMVLSRAAVRQYKTELEAMNAGTFRYHRPKFMEPFIDFGPDVRETLAARASLESTTQEVRSNNMKEAFRSTAHQLLSEIAKNTADTKRAIEEKPVTTKVTDKKLLTQYKVGRKPVTKIINL